MGIRSHVGETVNFSFNSSVAGNASILDSNGVARPVQTWERLIIDAVTVVSNQGNGGVYPTFLADSNANTVPLVALSSMNGNNTQGQTLAIGLPGEGLALSVGGTIYVQTQGDSTCVTGTARITNGTSQGVRPNFRELLTPGGNIGGR